MAAGLPAARQDHAIRVAHRQQPQADPAQAVPVKRSRARRTGRLLPPGPVADPARLVVVACESESIAGVIQQTTNKYGVALYPLKGQGGKGFSSGWHRRGLHLDGTADYVRPPAPDAPRQRHDQSRKPSRGEKFDSTLYSI